MAQRRRQAGAGAGKAMPLRAGRMTSAIQCCIAIAASGVGSVAATTAQAASTKRRTSVLALKARRKPLISCGGDKDHMTSGALDGATERHCECKCEIPGSRIEHDRFRVVRVADLKGPPDESDCCAFGCVDVCFLGPPGGENEKARACASGPGVLALAPFISPAATADRAAAFRTQIVCV